MKFSIFVVTPCENPMLYINHIREYEGEPYPFDISINSEAPSLRGREWTLVRRDECQATDKYPFGYSSDIYKIYDAKQRMKTLDDLRQAVLDEIKWLEECQDVEYHSPRRTMHGDDCGVGEARADVYKALALYYKAGGTSSEFDHLIEE